MKRKSILQLEFSFDIPFTRDLFLRLPDIPILPIAHFVIASIRLFEAKLT